MLLGVYLIPETLSGQYLDANNKDHEDDIFESTPYKDASGHQRGSASKATRCVLDGDRNAPLRSCMVF